MTFKEALEYFGNKYRMAIGCNVAASTTYTWARRGFIPYAAQLEIQKLTENDLIANYDHGKKV